MTRKGLLAYLASRAWRRGTALALVCVAPAAGAEMSGFHFGTLIGAGFPLHAGNRLQAGSGFTTSAFDLYPASNDRAGVLAGVNVGYDWRTGPWVYGVETELSYLDTRRGPSGVFLAPPSYWPQGLVAYGMGSEPNGNYLASLRARLGYAFGDTLAYGFGGVAAGGWLGASTLAFYGPDGLGGFFYAPLSQSSQMKYILGAGLEHWFDDRWSARSELAFLNQALQNQVYASPDDFQYGAYKRNETWLLRFGLNYRLPDSDDAGKDSKDQDAAVTPDASKSERYSVHFQATDVVQGYPAFYAPYSGPKSFRPQGQARNGSTSNLFIGVRLWEGASAFVNPEIDQGYGLSNSAGAAAYVNGAVAKVGAAAPYYRMQRYFLRQIIGLGGGEGRDPEEGSYNEALESAQNQLAGVVDKNRIILTLGKFAVGDVFDDNVYAHDPNTGFLNFAFNIMGGFDYAADAWGYTYGAAAEWKQDWWTLRGGLFQLSQVPNGPEIEPVIGRQYMGVVEAEARYDLFAQPGAIKFLAYADNGFISSFDEVTRLSYATGIFPPSIENLRARRVKVGGGINLKQQIMPNLGFFLRASMTDGRYETVDYTDVQRQVSFGVVASGPLWKDIWDRPKDEIGAAIAFSGLTGSQVGYFQAGGESVYIGDGGMTYGGEKVTELYYKYTVNDWFDMTLDNQFIINPGHNSARGPVNVFGVRAHVAF